MKGEIQITLTQTVDNMRQFKRALEVIVQDQVLVGVPEEKSGRKESGKITNAALAYIHNTGQPSLNIPARPFMEPGVKDAQQAIEKQMQQIPVAAAQGNATKVRRILEAVGMLAQNAIRNRINAGVPPPLKPGTLAARKRQGFRGEKPLIRTGQLRNAIVYVVQRIARRLK